MLMHQTMRWFGPDDPVSLADIRQAGCAGVVTALHHIAVGEVWPEAEIDKRRKEVEAAGMSWTVVESLPVSEDIKKNTGKSAEHLEKYKQSLRNLAACGIKVVTYNFMPVMDWMRTNLSYAMPDGSRALLFERNALVAFDLFMLKRTDAEKEYTAAEKENAAARYSAMTDAEKSVLYNTVLKGLPGSEEQFTEAQFCSALAFYKEMGAEKLRQHLFQFLREVVPVAEECGIALAIHPDDPPYPVLGIPRVVSTEEDLADLLAAAPSPANGLCFCTGSLGVRPDNDIPAMLKRFGDQIYFLHLRNTIRNKEGDFYEADHLEGDTDMVGVIAEILRIQKKRQISIPMRPDHGHQMLDDLQKKTNPGYSAIGRLRGLAELRGVEKALCQTIL